MCVCMSESVCVWVCMHACVCVCVHACVDGWVCMRVWFVHLFVFYWGLFFLRQDCLKLSAVVLAVFYISSVRCVNLLPASCFMLYKFWKNIISACYSLWLHFWQTLGNNKISFLIKWLSNACWICSMGHCELKIWSCRFRLNGEWRKEVADVQPS